MSAIRLADMGSADDRAAIDAFVAAHPHATPFHRTEWLEAIAKGTRQKAHCLITSSPLPVGEGQIASSPLPVGEGLGVGISAILPLHEIHSALFGRALVSTGFAVGGGILAHDYATAEALADAAWSLATRLNCPTLELRGGWLPQHWPQDTTTYLGFARDLAPDDEAELLAIPRKQRAEVRKALANDLTIDLNDRAAHYAVYAASVRNLGTPVFPRALFDAVLDGFGADADILTIRADGVPLASVLSLYHRGTVMPYWGGGTAAARPLRANDMMYFALMRHARERGCTRFDFGRSKAGTGAAAFKHNWGFEGAPLAYAKRTADGRAPREINPLDPRYALQVRLWSKLPLVLANRLGPMIARGLG